MPKAFKFYIIKDPKTRYNRYLRSAEKRGLVFELTLEQFIELTSKNCKHCGRLRVEGYYTGLDRVDSDVGYILSNVVPSCWPCNKWKGEDEYVDMVRHCVNILSHNGIIFTNEMKEILTTTHPTINEDPFDPNAKIKQRKKRTHKKKNNKQKEQSINNFYVMDSTTDSTTDSTIISYQNPDDYKVWPEFKDNCASAKSDVLDAYNKKRIYITEMYGRNKHGMKKQEMDYEYFALLAKKKILRKFLHKDLSTSFPFKYYGQVFRAYLHAKKRVKQMRLEHYIPVLKDTLCPEFNNLVIKQCHADINNNNYIHRSTLLYESVWKVLKHYLTEAHYFLKYLTVKDRQYWSEEKRKHLVITSNLPHINRDVHMSLYLPTLCQAMERVIEDTYVDRAPINDDESIPDESITLAKGKPSIDKSKFVEQFINDLYVTDEKTFIPTAKLLNQYQLWLEKQLPYNKNANISSVSMMGKLLSKLGMINRRSKNNNGYGLKLQIEEPNDDEELHEDPSTMD